MLALTSKLRSHTSSKFQTMVDDERLAIRGEANGKWDTVKH